MRRERREENGESWGAGRGRKGGDITRGGSRGGGKKRRRECYPPPPQWLVITLLQKYIFSPPLSSSCHTTTHHVPPSSIQTEVTTILHPIQRAPLWWKSYRGVQGQDGVVLGGVCARIARVHRVYMTELANDVVEDREMGRERYSRQRRKHWCLHRSGRLTFLLWTMATNPKLSMRAALVAMVITGWLSRSKHL